MMDDKKKRWQIWRRTFVLNNTSIIKPLTIKLGKSTLFLKPISKTKGFGYYQTSFMDYALDESRAKKISEEDFQYFSDLFRLERFVLLQPKWIVIGLVSKTKWKYERQTLSIQSKGKVKHPNLTTFDFEYLNKIYNKIERSKFKNSVMLSVHWLEKKTSSPLEEFLCTWISFNIVYRIMSPTATETSSLENLPNLFTDYNKLKKFLDVEIGIVPELIKLKLVSDSGAEYSKLLKIAYKKNQVRKVYSYILLCIYVIRSQLFHKGNYDKKLLRTITHFLQPFIKMVILKII